MKPKFKWIFCILLSIIALVLGTILILDSLGSSTAFIKLDSLGSSLFEKASPEDTIKENQIKVYPDRVVIYIKDASLASYTPTKSMDPVLDSTANGIEIPVTSSDQVHIGDIIVFEQDGSMIAHRVKKIGTDKQGWYCITQGDNAPLEDGKIRIQHIIAKTIVIIY